MLSFPYQQSSLNTGGNTMEAEEYRKIITTAVENENEAYDFYKAAGKKVKDANLKNIFNELADEEKDHKEFLQGLLTKPKPIKFDKVLDYKISETVEKPILSINMKPADAIALAMKNEEEAMQMYTELAKASADREHRELFESLARMEEGHKVRLEAIYTDMAYPEEW